MAIIENKIQYDWVRKRVSKLKERVDETTPLENRYRIELELLSKLEKEYSEEYSSALEQEITAVTNNIEKKQINIYEGLPIILEKVKGVALAAVIGRSPSWITAKLYHHNTKNGTPRAFVLEDLDILNNGLCALGFEIQQNEIQHSTDREAVIGQVKALSKIISMPYVYMECLKVPKRWFESRLAKRSAEGKACSFKEEDIHQINMAAMQIANELKSIEFVL